MFHIPTPVVNCESVAISTSLVFGHHQGYQEVNPTSEQSIVPSPKVIEAVVTAAEMPSFSPITRPIIPLPARARFNAPLPQRHTDIFSPSADPSPEPKSKKFKKDTKKKEKPVTPERVRQPYPTPSLSPTEGIPIPLPQVADELVRNPTTKIDTRDGLITVGLISKEELEAIKARYHKVAGAGGA